MAEHKLDIKFSRDTHTSPSRASYGMSLVSILEKIDCIITAPHYMYPYSLPASATLRQQSNVMCSDTDANIRAP